MINSILRLYSYSPENLNLFWVRFYFDKRRKSANVKGPCYHCKKELKTILEIIGLPANTKELIKLTKYREALWK